mmetsp:Transcript_104774/g.313004  ORF Transcript_104774/g.313004 Transcript_104774/m.313004 type:complete len:184 (+) Transcript_104774:85-636(+)
MGLMRHRRGGSAASTWVAVLAVKAAAALEEATSQRRLWSYGSAHQVQLHKAETALLADIGDIRSLLATGRRAAAQAPTATMLATGSEVVANASHGGNFTHAAGAETGAASGSHARSLVDRVLDSPGAAIIWTVALVLPVPLCCYFAARSWEKRADVEPDAGEADELAEVWLDSSSSRKLLDKP